MLSLSTLLAAILFIPRTTDDYRESLTSLTELDQKMNLGEPVGPQLLEVLARLPDFAPMLSQDPEALQGRTRAQLNLARSYLSEGDRTGAEGIMDEVIRSSMGEPLPIEQMSPSLLSLHDERMAALGGMGTAAIDVRCDIPCRIYIDEHVAEAHTEGLYLGVYRIWVEPADGESTVEPVIEQLSLSEANTTAHVQFPADMEHIPQAPAPVKQPPRRIMPAGAEAGMIAGGLALAAAGVLMVSINPGDNPVQTGVGGLLTGLGGASMLTGGIALGIDEVRLGEQRGRQAVISWRMRF